MADDRAEEYVSRAPAAQRDRVRAFAEQAIADVDVARGRVPAVDPAELLRILGGDTVPPGGFPSCCCVGEPARWLCTGVVVAPTVVLTAAHCGGNVSRVMVGGNQVTPSVGPGGRVVPVRRVIVHPGYRDRPVPDNDISILILDAPAQVPPVALATVDQLRDAVDVELVGFGSNDAQAQGGFGTKRQVRVRMGVTRLSDDEDLSEFERFLGFHADYEFVAGRKGLGRDTCGGDSGGPAYLLANGTLTVAGLTSRATREAPAGEPCGHGGVYVRPDRFRDWINEVLAAAGLSGLP